MGNKISQKRRHPKNSKFYIVFVERAMKTSSVVAIIVTVATVVSVIAVSLLMRRRRNKRLFSNSLGSSNESSVLDADAISAETNSNPPPPDFLNVGETTVQMKTFGVQANLLEFLTLFKPCGTEFMCSGNYTVKAAQGSNFVGIETRGPCALKAVYIYGHYERSMIPIGWQMEQGSAWIPLGPDYTTLHVLKYSGSNSASASASASAPDSSHDIFVTKAVLSTLSTPLKLRFLFKLPQEISGESGVVGAVSTVSASDALNLDSAAASMVAFSAFGMLT